MFLFGARFGRRDQVEPCSVGASLVSLIGEFSAKEPVSSIKIGSCSEDLADLGNFEVLLEAIRKDFLEDLAVDFGVEDFGCQGEVDNFACMVKRLRTSRRSVYPAVF